MLNTTHNKAALDKDIKPDKEDLCATPYKANDFMSLQDIVKYMAQGSKIELLRVDRLLVRSQPFDKITDSFSKL